jgi:hypothetical protein
MSSFCGAGEKSTWRMLAYPLGVHDSRSIEEKISQPRLRHRTSPVVRQRR